VAYLIYSFGQHRNLAHALKILWTQVVTLLHNVHNSWKFPLCNRTEQNRRDTLTLFCLPLLTNWKDRQYFP